MSFVVDLFLCCFFFLFSLQLLSVSRFEIVVVLTFSGFWYFQLFNNAKTMSANEDFSYFDIFLDFYERVIRIVRGCLLCIL